MIPWSRLLTSCAIIFCALILSACAPAATPTATALPPTPTNAPTLTQTPAAVMPTATPTTTPSPSPTPRIKTGIADQWLGKADEREKLFDAYIQTIKSGHVFSELGIKRLDITLDQEIQRTKKRFIEADTQSDVYYALLSLQRLLHDAHSGLTAPQELIPRFTNIGLPFTLAPRGNSLASAQYVVVASSLPELKTGWMLKEYQGKSIAQLEYEYIEWLDCSSPEILKIELARALTRPASSRMPQPDPSLPVVATFMDPGSKAEIKITTSWRAATTEAAQDDYRALTPDYQGIHYRTYKGLARDTLVVVYSSFNYVRLNDADLKSALARASFPVPTFDASKPLAEQRDWLLRLLRANDHPDAERLVAGNISLTSAAEALDILTLGKYLTRQTEANLLLDVRNNSGGNVNTDLTRLFATQPFTGPARGMIYTPLVRSDASFLEGALAQADSRQKPIIRDQIARQKDATQSRVFPWYCKTGSCTSDEGVFPPNPAIKKFNFAVLSGPVCASGCDNFVASIKDNAIGKVVGLPPRGASAPFRADKPFALNNGQTFSMILNTGSGVRANGESLEGNPAAVEYYLFPEDAYIAKMIEYLRKQNFFK